MSDVTEREQDTDGPTIHRRIDLDAPVEDLWEIVTDTDGPSWLGDVVDVDLSEPGASGDVTDDGVIRRVDVDDVRRGERIDFTWERTDTHERSRVRLVFAPTERGSALHITETLIPGAAVAHRQAFASASMPASLAWDVRAVTLWLRATAITVDA